MINKLIASRYRIIERVGIGGMAEVYKAQDEVLGRIDAVKVLLPQFASDPTFAARFRQEAQAAANLASPYIVNIYDWGLDGETYYIVMEYVRGVDLKTAIAQRGAIDQRKVAQIASQICSGLAVAHDHDVIHRDIKPQNIMIQPDGNIKIMDFGVARAGNSTMTQTGSVLGTANYVSPEQAQGKIPTAASDLYSLGILMYEAVTGRLPFEGPDAISVALKQVNEEPVPPSRYMPTIDPVFEGIILKAMEKDPELRFTSAEEMRNAINNYLNGNPVNFGAAAPTAVLGAGAGATRVINGRDASRTSVMPAHAQHGSGSGYNGNAVRRPDQEKKKMSNGKKALIAVLIVAAIAVIGGLAFAFSGAGGGTVPNVVGQNQADAEKQIIESGYTVGNVTKDYSDTVQSGQVMKQTPGAGSIAEKGSSIDLVISEGPKPPNQVAVPDLSGMTAAQAGQALQERNLVGAAGDAVYDPNVPAGQVAKQDPAAGTTVNEGTTVTFYLSLGPESTPIPDVEGMSESEARSRLSNAGFSVSVQYDYSDTVSQGKVISQSKTGTADKGSTITITVSQGQKSETVPNLYGMTLSQAKSAVPSGVHLSASGDTSDPNAVIVSQSPSYGSEISSGETISVTLRSESSGN